MDTDSEIFIIHAARQGSQQAWRNLFDRHFDAVYSFCLTLTESRHDLAEEITQQVFITAVKRLHRFDSARATFRSWLFGVARKRHLSIMTDRRRRMRHEQSSVKDSSKKIETGDSELWVHEVLARLPSHYRMVLEAKYIKGLTMNQIAADTKASIEAVESLLRRARAGFAREYRQLQNMD